jgi:hypothetical protein
MNKTIAMISIIALIGVGGWYLYQSFSGAERDAYRTFFNYSPGETDSLRTLTSSETMTVDDLYALDEKAFDAIAENKVGTEQASKIYAVLTIAQRDAAYLSHNSHAAFQGNLEPITEQVLCVFIPKSCNQASDTSDPYSEELARLVITKVKSRIADEKKSIAIYPVQANESYWTAASYSGQDVGSWQLWILPSVSEFRLSPPGEPTSEAMQSQLAQVKKNIEDITTEKRSAVLRWSGGAGTNTAAGQWLALSDSYMKKTNVSDLENALRVRAAIALSIADLLIVAHDSKYTYWSPRPQMIDSSIRTIVPTPNHPSYPSTSAAIGAAGATILSHYFPENANEWNGIADEIGQSRLWAGIHFKIDVDQGQVLGKRVANAVLASPRIQ